MKNKKLVRVSALLGAISLSPLAQAVNIGGIEFEGSGFMTLGAGKMLGGTKGQVMDRDCPCFTSDYAQGGVYDDRGGLQFKPDSKLGLQGVATVNKQLSFTGQAVFRGARDGDANLEWLYGSYKLNDNLTLQVGRKRLPMFYYSDTQDIGLALPWTHLPAQLYGWEAVNYNGINIAYQGQAGEWRLGSNFLWGAERYKDSGYYKIYYGKNNKTDVKWNNILGADFSFSRDWFEGRLVYIQSDTQSKSVNGSWFDTPEYSAPSEGYSERTKQRIYGASFNIDYNDFLARSEFIHIDRPGASYKDFARILAVGYRWGKWTPMLTWSHYWGQANVANGGVPDDQEQHTNWAYTLRYELSTSSAVKVQYDYQKERGGSGWILDNGVPRYGDAKLLTVAYDMVF